MTQAHDTLVAARRARQAGDHPRADELYRQCVDMTPSAAVEYAGYLHEYGRSFEAESVLSGLIAGTAPTADLHFLRGLVRSSLRLDEAALEDFQAALNVSPHHVPALFHRAQLNFRLEQAAAALADFELICRIDPNNSEAWANAGIILQRSGDAERATTTLEHACRLAPANPTIRRALANAHASCNRIKQALSHFQLLEANAGTDAALLTDHALCLLRDGQVDAALRKYKLALGLDPGDQTALAGLYLHANQTGDSAVARRLMQPGLVMESRLPPGIDLDALLSAVLSHPGLAWEPAGRSTLGGQQTTMLDLGEGGPYAPLARAIETLVQDHLDQLARNPELAGHPWLAGLPGSWRIQAWATVLHHGGHQRPHIHPAGWLSGVLYLDPGSLRTAGREGHLVFGHPQLELGLSPAAQDWSHRPIQGQVLLFPSYFFHHTVPYDGEQPRVSLAFDVIPERHPHKN